MIHSNAVFIRGVKSQDSSTVVVSRDQLNKAINAIKKAQANGDKCVNIYAYSRGGPAALALAKELNGLGINVRLLVLLLLRFRGR